MLSEGPFLLRIFAETLRIRVERFGTPPTLEESTLARRALAELRVGLDRDDSEIVLLVRRLIGSEDSDAFDSTADAPFSRGGSELNGAVDLLQLQFESGRLKVEREQPPTVPQAVEPPFPDLPLPSRPRESTDNLFDVRFLDEIGQAINGLAVEFELAGDVQEVTTNPAGVALLENVQATSATVAVPDATALESIVDPRWQKPRPGQAPKGPNTTRVAFDGAPISAIPVKAAVPNTVVVTPPLGKLFVELSDRTGRVRHANKKYSISGPATLSGTTDEHGRLLHESVFPGDYTLSFAVDSFEGPDLRSDSVTSPLVVLSASTSQPEVRMLGAVPHLVLVRLRGLFFDTNKSFLRPPGVKVFGRLGEVYAQNVASQLLIVGHTDTTGEASINDPLSLERADNTRAFLTHDVDTWLAMYDDGVASKRRWGSVEDDLMLASLPDFETRPPGEDPVRWFQRMRGLKVDGVSGPETRRQLVTEYMDQAEVRPDDPAFDISITTHGCGENFPLDETGDDLDPAPADDQEDAVDRRVELFFFDGDFGIVPPPPGKNSGPGSREYPAWRKRVDETRDFDADEGLDTLRMRLHDEESKPIARASCRVIFAGDLIGPRSADDDGFLVIHLPPACPETLRVEWGPEDSEPPFPFSYDVIPECNEGAGEDQDRRRLHNLGYSVDLPFDVAAARFQADYGIDDQPEPVGLVSGELPPDTKAKLTAIFEGDCDASIA